MITKSQFNIKESLWEVNRGNSLSTNLYDVNRHSVNYQIAIITTNQLVSILSSARFKVVNGTCRWGPSEIEQTWCVIVHEGKNTAE